MADQSQQKVNREYWQQQADQLRSNAETRLFIDGGYVSARGDEQLDNVNPVTGEVWSRFSIAQESDVDRAVQSALKTYRSGAWSKMPPRDRMEVLYRFADLIEANAHRLAIMETMDMGKPITDVLETDIPMAVETIRFMAECIDKVTGSVTNTSDDVMHFVVREPLGVVGAISPWNYPLLMAVWKIAPALAAGNTVVLKPAEEAPTSCLKMAELFMEAGGPAGALNVVNGVGEVAGQALALHNDVHKITFTGSTAVGKLMLRYAGESNMKKVGLECGGKTPQIFLGDIDDMERAVAAAYHGIFANMGEVCNAGSRLLVQRDIHEAFVDEFVSKGRMSYVPGDPLDPDTNLGPLVTHEAQKRVLGMIDEAKSAGAKLEFGGEAAADFPQGAYVNPTLFTGVNNKMEIARKEIFGPVASVIPFDTMEEAVAIANDTIYGLAAGIWTKDLDKAHSLIKQIEAGTIWVNTFDAGDMTQPFGGYKQSGNARDKCFDSLLEYTQTKSAWIQLHS